MKTTASTALAGLAAVMAAIHVNAASLLSDTWTDGSRNEQNLPNESAWYASTASSLTASAGSMLGQPGSPTGSRVWLTYFTDAGSPTTLGVGNSISATWVFTPTTVSTATGRGLRLGLFNFGETSAARQTADTFSTSGIGQNVTGYIVNMNFAQSAINTPIQILQRDPALAAANLMGTTSSGAYNQIGSSGGGAAGDGFVSGTQYTFQFFIERTGADEVALTATFTDGNTFNRSLTVTDTSGANFSFDAFALRPDGAQNSAESFTFHQFQVVVVPEPASMLLLIGGLGMAGALHRLRRKN